MTPAWVSTGARSGPALDSASEPASTSAPTNQADHMVSTDMSNARLKPPNTRSSQSSARIALSLRTRWQALRCRMRTPLGRPVEPEV